MISINKALFLLLVVLVLLQGCRIEKEPFKIGLTTWPGYAYAFIAQEKGFFEKNGVEVNLVLNTDTSKNFELYKNEEIDAFLDPYPYALEAVSSGIPTKVVFITDYSDSGDVIVAKPELRDLNKLKGKTLGFEGFNSFSHLFVIAFIEKAGWNEDDVFFKNILTQKIVDELESGSIDAGHTWEPAKSEALEKGYVVIAKAGDFPGLITDVLGFHSEVVEKRPEDIKMVVKSLLEARDFVYSNPEEALQLMSQAENISIEDLRSGIKGVIQPDLEENLRAMQRSDYNWSLYSTGKTISNFYIKRGQFSYQPDLDMIIEPRFIQELAAEKG